MIVLQSADDLLLITQGDHAHLAAEILSLCRVPELLDHPRRNRLLEATREHDNGWRESDAAPLLDPDSGEPYSFLTLPGDERRRIWRRGCARNRDVDPWVAALITQHALHVHREALESPDWTDWHSETERHRDELLEAAALDLETLLADYRWLRFADLCSLAACGAPPDRFDHHGFTGEAADGVLRLDPLPLAGATSFEVSCRRVPRRAYADATDLAIEMASARWKRRTVRLTGVER